MPHLIATTRPVLWAVGDPIVAAGLTEPGGTTVTGLALISNEDENAYLGAVAGKSGAYKPLPAAGVWLESGDIYGYGGGLVIVRQSHIRTEHAPETVPALFSVYRAGGGVLEWVANERVEVGTRRTYGGVLYEAIQAHTTQTDWSPVATLGTLWRAVVVTANWAVGVAYKVGDEVIHLGLRYRCRQAHTSIASWSPPAILSLWLPI